MKIFEKLISKVKASTASDGFTQPEREAIIDLLILGAYTDNHLSLAEDKAFDEVAGTMNWESDTDISYYIDSATERARNTQGDPNGVHEFLNLIGQRLESRASVSKALKLLHKVFVADGRTFEEANFYRTAESHLKR